MLLMRGEGETTDGSIPAFTSGGMEMARGVKGARGGGMLKGWWSVHAGRGGDCKAFWGAGGKWRGFDAPARHF